MSGPQEFRVVVTYKYPVDMELAEAEYGTTDLAEMAAIDTENFASGVILSEDLQRFPFTVAVDPVREDSREPYLIHYRREIERMNVRLQRSFLAHNPNATAADLIAVIDPDKKDS